MFDRLKTYEEVARFGKVEGKAKWHVDHDRLDYSDLEKLRAIVGRGELAWGGALRGLSTEQWQEMSRVICGRDCEGAVVQETTNRSNGFPVFSFILYWTDAAAPPPRPEGGTGPR